MSEANRSTAVDEDGSGSVVEDALAEAAGLAAAWDFRAARQVLDDLLDEPLPHPWDALRLRAVVRRELGDLTGALADAERAADGADARYGPADPDTVRALAVVGMVRHDLGDWDVAEVLYHQVLDSGVEEDGPAGRAVRLTRANFALLQRDRGDHAMAVILLNAAYAVHRREYGPDDLDTVRIAAELAEAHRDAGDISAARRLFAVAHAGASTRLGESHPFTRSIEEELEAVEPVMPAPLPIGEPPSRRRWLRRHAAPEDPDDPFDEESPIGCLPTGSPTIHSPTAHYPTERPPAHHPPARATPQRSAEPAKYDDPAEWPTTPGPAEGPTTPDPVGRPAAHDRAGWIATRHAAEWPASDDPAGWPTASCSADWPTVRHPAERSTAEQPSGWLQTEPSGDRPVVETPPAGPGPARFPEHSSSAIAEPSSETWPPNAPGDPARGERLTQGRSAQAWASDRSFQDEESDRSVDEQESGWAPVEQPVAWPSVDPTQVEVAPDRLVDEREEAGLDDGAGGSPRSDGRQSFGQPHDRLRRVGGWEWPDVPSTGDVLRPSLVDASSEWWPVGVAPGPVRRAGSVPWQKLLIFGVSALVAVVVGVVAIFLADPPRRAPRVAAPVATTGGRVPLGPMLKDDGETLTVTWAAQPLDVVVALSRAGGAPTVLADLPAGASSYVVHGLDRTAQYCVVIGMVVDGADLSAATSVCTSR